MTWERERRTDGRVIGELHVVGAHQKAGAAQQQKNPSEESSLQRNRKGEVEG